MEVGHRQDGLAIEKNPDLRHGVAVAVDGAEWTGFETRKSEMGEWIGTFLGQKWIIPKKPDYWTLDLVALSELGRLRQMD